MEQSIQETYYYKHFFVYLSNICYLSFCAITIIYCDFTNRVNYIVGFSVYLFLQIYFWRKHKNKQQICIKSTIIAHIYLLMVIVIIFAPFLNEDGTIRYKYLFRIPYCPLQYMYFWNIISIIQQGYFKNFIKMRQILNQNTKKFLVVLSSLEFGLFLEYILYRDPKILIGFQLLIAIILVYLLINFTIKNESLRTAIIKIYNNE